MQTPRKIIHIDFDAFYASIEMRDNPKLQDKPIAVGGSPDKRGVIATCNYEARRFGVHSAMASSQALKQCPQLIIVPPRFAVYKQISAAAHDIFRQYTDVIEPLSLDEAYLDVTEATACKGSATWIAKAIQQEIADTLQLTVSAGVAPNKFLAKIASDWQKPNGLFVITPDQVDDFVRVLPVNKVHGVGKVTTQKLHSKGIETCEQLRAHSLLELTQWFGVFGEQLWKMSRGEDNRPVKSERQRKSISVEHTYEQDLASLEAVLAKIPELYAELMQRFEKLSANYTIQKYFVKVKFANFTQTTLEEQLPSERISPEQYLTDLMIRAWQRGEKSVRLLGVGMRIQPKRSELEQLTLF